MKLTKLALKRPVSVILMICTLIVFGITSLYGFKLAYLPAMEPPVLVVLTSYNGADPEIVDSTVTDPIEDLGATLKGFVESTTTSEEGFSTVVFQFEYETDLDQTYQDLKAAIDRLQLPDECNTPMLMQVSLGADAMMRISVTGSNNSEVLDYVNDVMVPQIETISDVAKVEVFGGLDEYIRVKAEPEAMEQYGVTLGGIADAIKASDLTVPAGKVDQGTQSISLSSSAAPTSLDALNKVPIRTASNTVITVGDVAEVSYYTDSAESISRYNGVENIGIDITSSQDASIPDVSKKVYKELDKLDVEAFGYEITVISDSSEQIESSLMSVAQTLVLGVALCMIVLFLFFGDWKASLIVGSSIPMSLLMTLICMRLLEFELNVVTTVALLISIGMMVDNSIVTLESIFRAKENEESYVKAALRGCKSVGSSVVASTVTSVVVYLPLAVMSGMTGEMFSDFGYTIVFALVASLISAISIVPMFYTLLKPEEKNTSHMSAIMERLIERYTVAIRKVLNKKKMAIFIAVGGLVLSGLLITQIPFELTPEVDLGVMDISAKFRPGTQLVVMDEKVQEIESILAEDERIETYSLSIRGDSANIKVETDEKTPTNDIIAEYMVVLSHMTDMDIDISLGGFGRSMNESKTAITLSSYDYDALKMAADDFQEKMYEIPGVLKVNSSLGNPSTKAEVIIDPLLVARYGLNSVQVASLIRLANTGSEVMDMTVKGTEYTVMVEYPEDTYSDFNSIMQLTLNTASGPIPLSEVAEIQFTDELQEIERANGVYYIELEAVCSDENEEDIAKELKELGESVDYGESIDIGKAVKKNNMVEELSRLVGAIMTAMFLVFMVMAMQFESPRFSLMVMTSVIFSFIGSFGLLFLSGQSISMISLMGMLMLIGIVVNNGILFVDTTNSFKKDMSLEEALVKSGQMRMRPILMTTLTTVLSMLPLALAIGEGAKSMQSMGIIIVGGLIASTILVLFLMPTFYLIIGERKKPKKIQVPSEIDA